MWRGAIVTVFDPLTALSSMKDIDQRLFPGRCRSLPDNWQIGRKPVAALPIDDFITDMRCRTRKPLLRDPDDMGRYTLGACSYAMARSSVAWAFYKAGVQLELNDLAGKTTSSIGRLKDDLEALRSQLLFVSGQIKEIADVQIQYQEYSNFGLLRDLSDLAIRTEFAIAKSLPIIKSDFLERSQYQGELWRQFFVASLSGAWWRLTGGDPSPTGPFIEFVEASWASLSDDVAPAAWESVIKTIKKRGAGSFPWREDPGVGWAVGG